MPVEEQQYVVVFESVHATLRFEALLRGLGMTYQIVPTPRKISADCGLAIKLSPAEWRTLSQALLKAPPEAGLNLPWKASFQVYRITKEGEPTLVTDSG